MINEHFETIKEQIEQNVKLLIGKENLNEEEKNKLKQIKQKQLEKISEIEKLNSPKSFKKQEYSTKWCHVMNDVSIDDKNKIDLIKEGIILFDCVLLERDDVSNGLDLWINDWYYNQKNLQILK